MIPILIVFVILTFISIKLYMNMKKSDVNNVLNNSHLDSIAEILPDNISICADILNMLNVKNINVKLNEDKKSENSFYNVFSKDIILCDNDKVNRSYTRVLFIAHECVHASQKQSQLKFNFMLANVNILFCIISTILIWINVIQEPLYLTIFGIALILNMFSFFARNAIESDATYMSILVARRYLEKFIDLENVKIIEKEYEKIISKGYTTFTFSLFTTNIFLILIQVISLLICTYI